MMQITQINPSYFTVLVASLITGASIYFIVTKVMGREVKILEYAKDFVFYGVVYYLIYRFSTTLLEYSSLSIFKPNVDVTSNIFAIAGKMTASIFLALSYVVFKGLNPLGAVKMVIVMFFAIVGLPYFGTFIVGLPYFGTFIVEGIPTSNTSDIAPLVDLKTLRLPSSDPKYSSISPTDAAIGVGLSVLGASLGILSKKPASISVPASIVFGGAGATTAYFRQFQALRLQDQGRLEDTKYLVKVFDDNQDIRDIRLKEHYDNRFDRIEKMIEPKYLADQNEAIKNSKILTMERDLHNPANQTAATNNFVAHSPNEVGDSNNHWLFDIFS